MKNHLQGLPQNFATWSPYWFTFSLAATFYIWNSPLRTINRDFLKYIFNAKWTKTRYISYLKTNSKIPPPYPPKERNNNAKFSRFWVIVVRIWHMYLIPSNSLEHDDCTIQYLCNLITKRKAYSLLKKS